MPRKQTEPKNVLKPSELSNPKSTIKKVKTQESWPKVVQGSHSTFIEHENGNFEHIIDWTKLAQDIDRALTEDKKSGKIKTTKTSKVKNEA